MTTIHKALAEIRELRHEELDLVGGAYSSEPSQISTASAITICDPRCGCGTISVPDDMIIDNNSD